VSFYFCYSLFLYCVAFRLCLRRSVRRLLRRSCVDYLKYKAFARLLVRAGSDEHAVQTTFKYRQGSENLLRSVRVGDRPCDR
jgi:hypothetical protein